jgi:hypothetical protein
MPNNNNHYVRYISKDDFIEIINRIIAEAKKRLKENPSLATKTVVFQISLESKFYQKLTQDLQDKIIQKALGLDVSLLGQTHSAYDRYYDTHGFKHFKWSDLRDYEQDGPTYFRGGGRRRRATRKSNRRGRKGTRKH